MWILGVVGSVVLLVASAIFICCLCRIDIDFTLLGIRVFCGDEDGNGEYTFRIGNDDQVKD